MRIYRSEKQNIEKSCSFLFNSSHCYAEQSEAFRVFLKGFTLPEVCVALAIFLVGMTAIFSAWNFFNREVTDERLRMEYFDDTVLAIEKLIAERPLCTDSNANSVTLVQNQVNIHLQRMPGSKNLVWAFAERKGISLKRLIRCK